MKPSWIKKIYRIEPDIANGDNPFTSRASAIPIFGNKHEIFGKVTRQGRLKGESSKSKRNRLFKEGSLDIIRFLENPSVSKNNVEKANLEKIRGNVQPVFLYPFLLRDYVMVNYVKNDRKLKKDRPWWSIQNSLKFRSFPDKIGEKNNVLEMAWKLEKQANFDFDLYGVRIIRPEGAICNAKDPFDVCLCPSITKKIVTGKNPKYRFHTIPTCTKNFPKLRHFDITKGSLYELGRFSDLSHFTSMTLSPKKFHPPYLEYLKDHFNTPKHVIFK